MAGRPKIFSEEEVIARASKVFWEKGYEAASAEELLKAMGIGKGSFYLFFKGGKKELYEKALQQFANNLLTRLRTDLANTTEPVAYLKDFFLKLADTSDGNGTKGCFMGNALVEMAAKDEFTRKMVSKLLEQLKIIFTDVVRSGQENSQLTTSVNPEILGIYLLNLWNGLNVTRRMYLNGDNLKSLIKLNLDILN